MREYGSVSPQFWIGGTGKDLRGKPECQVLSLYLMTSPHANMIGVFHCPVMYMGYETGLGLEGASKALESLIELGYCMYDHTSETVFVVRMAAHQVGESLAASDNRVKGVLKEVEKIAVPVLKAAFIAAYSDHYHLKASPLQAPSKGLSEAKQAPLKQLTGQEQEQEQEAPSAEASGTKRGSRLPQDWILPQDWEAFATHECGWSQTTVTREAAKFRDYWCAKPGKDGLKLDWRMTWCNWCRNSKTPKDSTPSVHGHFGKVI